MSQRFIWQYPSAFRGPWITQQLAHSRNVPFVFYRRAGPEPFILCWDCFYNWFRELRELRELRKNSRNGYTQLSQDTIWITMAANRRLVPLIDYINDVRTFVRADPRRLSFELFEESLQIAATTIQSADPRNKVYGLTSMFPQREGNKIPFDYNRSVATVFADAARYAITNTRSLGILSMAGLDNASEDPSLQDCPSWVPHFTPHQLCPLKVVPKWKLPHTRRFRGTEYRSSRDLRVPGRVEVLEGNRLVLYGIPIDEVTLVGSIPDQENPSMRYSAIVPAKVFTNAAKTCGGCKRCPQGVVKTLPTEPASSGSEDESISSWDSNSGSENQGIVLEDESIGSEDIERVSTLVFLACDTPLYSPEMPPIPPKQAQCLPDDLLYLHRRSVSSNTGSSELRTTATMKHHRDVGDTHGPEGHVQSAVPWKYSVSKPFRAAFWRAFVADFLLWGNTESRYLPFKAPPPDNVRDWVIFTLHQNTHGRMEDDIHNKLWGDPPDEVNLSRDVQHLWTLSLDSVVAGCPFVTAGGWLGFGPRCMKAGDVVVVLAGADVPFIVRRKDDESGDFLLVGEAYVDGLMFGELFENCPAFADDDEEYGIKMQRFCFC